MTRVASLPNFRDVLAESHERRGRAGDVSSLRDAEQDEECHEGASRGCAETIPRRDEESEAILQEEESRNGNSQSKSHDPNEDCEGKSSIEDSDTISDESSADSSEERRCVDDSELYFLISSSVYRFNHR